MSQLPPSDQTTQALVPVAAPGFEAAVQTFWEKNRSAVLLVCVVVLLAIVGREGWQYFSGMRERGVQDEYAKVADHSDKLAAFADANSGHALAGVAYLRLADEKYLAGDYKSASVAYGKAVGSLKNEILLGRAKLGAAMSQLNAGDRAAGEAALKALSADASLAKGVRAEATYQLAALAADAGKADDVKKLAEEVSKIDATSSWAQRATLLQVASPVGAKPADLADAGISFKPSGK